jgi:hypothetical protein
VAFVVQRRFGQSCEGEPLLQADLLCEVIAKIRQRTRRGTIHVNTNGTVPEAVARLRESGLDSLRVDVNSVRREYFNRYTRLNYEPVVERLRQAARERMERAKRGEPEPDFEGEGEEAQSLEPDDSFDKAKESLKVMKVPPATNGPHDTRSGVLTLAGGRTGEDSRLSGTCSCRGSTTSGRRWTSCAASSKRPAST